MHRVNAEPESAAPSAGPALRRLAVPLGVLGSVIAAFAYVGTVDPNEPGHYPACPLLQLTGVFCPGCGGLRSAHAFIHGDLTTALGANALAVVGYVLFAVLWTLWAARAARGRRLRIELGSAQLYGFGVLIALFTLVRNLPFGAWLHP